MSAERKDESKNIGSTEIKPDGWRLLKDLPGVKAGTEGIYKVYGIYAWPLGYSYGSDAMREYPDWFEPIWSNHYNKNPREVVPEGWEFVGFSKTPPEGATHYVTRILDVMSCLQNDQFSEPRTFVRRKQPIWDNSYKRDPKEVLAEKAPGREMEPELRAPVEDDEFIAIDGRILRCRTRAHSQSDPRDHRIILKPKPEPKRKRKLVIEVDAPEFEIDHVHVDAVGRENGSVVSGYWTSYCTGDLSFHIEERE